MLLEATEASERPEEEVHTCQTVSLRFCSEHSYVCSEGNDTAGERAHRWGDTHLPLRRGHARLYFLQTLRTCLTLVFRYYNCEVVTSRRAWESAERGAEARAFTAPSTEFVVTVLFVSHQGKLSLRVTVRIPPSSLTGDKCVLLVT